MESRTITKASISPNAKCAYCERALTSNKTFSDCSINGSWMWLCGACAKMLGARYGTGVGQQYDSKTLVKLRG